MTTKILSRPNVKFAGKLLVALLFTLCLTGSLDFSAVGEQIVLANLWLLLVSTFIFMARNVLGAYRWQVLLSTSGHAPPLPALYRYYFIGAFFNFFLPTAVGGDVARGYYLDRWGVGSTQAAGSVILERVLGVTALVFLSAVSVCLASGVSIDGRIQLVVFGACGCWFIVLALLIGSADTLIQRILPGRASQTLRIVSEVIREMRSYRASPAALVRGMCATVAFQGLGIFATYLLGLSVGSSIAAGYYFILLPIVWLVAMVPISINGIGLREGAFVALFLSVGMTKETAITISILFLAQAMLQGAIGGVLYLFMSRRGTAIASLTSS